MLINPLFSFLNDFISERGLSAPDGRAIYAYRCSDTEFSQLGILLRTHAPRKTTKFIFMNYTDVLFVLYASEYIRRNHVEGHPKWDGIVDSISWGQVPTPLLYKKTTDGIRFWKRDIRSIGHALGYLHTLACEGGLPIRMIENESGYLINYFRGIYSEIKGQHGNRPALDIAKVLGCNIPATMQNDLVYEVAGEFCHTLHTLLSQQGGSGMTSLNLLRKNIPEWYKKLPLVLPEESALDIVKKILSVDESGVAGTQLFRVERHWVASDGSWYCDAKFRIPRTLRTEQITDLFECKINSNQSRLILSAQWQSGCARLALLTKTEDQLWRVETLPAAGKPLTGSAALQNIIVTLHEGPCLLGQGTPKGGVALNEDMPWVFESINDSNTSLRLIGCGSVNSTKSTLFVSLPENSHLDLSGDGDFDVPQQINNSGRYLTKIRGSFNIVLQDGAVCNISSGQEVDAATEYYIKPTEVLNIKSDYPIHRSYPKIAWKNELGIGLVPEQEIIWRPIKLGSTSWNSMKNAMPKGQVEVRHVVGEQVCFSGRVVILPADFDIQFVPLNAQQGSIILTGVQQAKVERYQNNSNETVKSDLLLNSIEVQCDTNLSNNGNVDLRVHWADGCYLKLLLPLPVAGGRFVNATGDVYFQGLASVNAMHGVVADQSAIDSNGNAFINLVLRSSSPLSTKHQMLYVDVPLVGGSVSSHKQLSLYERMGLLRSILASSCSIDDYIQVEMYSDNHGRDPSTIKIQRYDGCFINKNDHLQIDLEGSITFPLTRRNEVIVKAVSLKNISNVPISLSQDVLGYNLDSLHDSDAPWLVFGILDDAIRIQPILLGSSIQYEEASPLLNALCSMGTKEYHRVIHGLLSSIESNPFHADFYELAQLMKAYKANHDLPLLLIGLFRELRNYPVVLVQLLIAASFASDFESVYTYQDELPFSWGWIPEPVWCTAFDQAMDALAEQMGNPMLAQQVMLPFLNQLIKTSMIDRRLAVVVRSLVRKVPASLVPSHDIPVVDDDLFRMAQQELVRYPDNFGRIGTFPKHVWLKVIPSSMHAALNRYWLENRYHKRFEKLFNLMLVASLLCQTETKHLSELSVLFEIHYQQAPQQLGVIYQYYFEMARKLI